MEAEEFGPQVISRLLRRYVKQRLGRSLGSPGRWLVGILAEDFLDAGDFVAASLLLAFVFDLPDEPRSSGTAVRYQYVERTLTCPR